MMSWSTEFRRRITWEGALRQECMVDSPVAFSPLLFDWEHIGPYLLRDGRVGRDISPGRMS